MCTDSLKIALQYGLPKRLLTMYFGWLAELRISWLKNHFIRRFIRRYNVDMSEARESSLNAYPTFNDFFIRHLKPGARPIAAADVISPVDGYVSEKGDIHEGRLLQAKGHYYNVTELLAADAAMMAPFHGGSFITLYLSPKDYHRVHMPMDAVLRSMIHVPGQLFSVQPLTTRYIPHLFARNQRLVVFFDTSIGPMAMVLVGATIVGAIGTAWHGDVAVKRVPQLFQYDSRTIALQQADEMGYFKLGSTVILLYSNQAQLQWNDALRPGARVQMGQALAQR